MKILKDIKVGDIFYTQFSKEYYFLQIIHITKDLPPPYDVDYKYGYFIIVFEKSFKELPKSIEELDLINIYKIKYKPKNTILFISHWDVLPEIKINPMTEDYKKHSKYEIKYFGNANVSKSFNPEILSEFILPANNTINRDGIEISHTPAGISWIFYIFEENVKNKEKEIEEVKIKMENIIQKYEEINDKNMVKRALKKCIIGINNLNRKSNFIMTIEAEEIYSKLISISKKYGIKETETEKIIEENRDW
jgi:hypothetical protein